MLLSGQVLADSARDPAGIVLFNQNFCAIICIEGGIVSTCRDLQGRRRRAGRTGGDGMAWEAPRGRSRVGGTWGRGVPPPAWPWPSAGSRHVRVRAPASSSFAAVRFNRSQDKHKYHFGVVTDWDVAQALVMEEVLAVQVLAISVRSYFTVFLYPLLMAASLGAGMAPVSLPPRYESCPGLLGLPPRRAGFAFASHLLTRLVTEKDLNTRYFKQSCR